MTTSIEFYNFNNCTNLQLSAIFQTMSFPFPIAVSVSLSFSPPSPSPSPASLTMGKA